MALIKCPECRRENISNKALQCPSCSYPIKATTIEKTAKHWKKLQIIYGALVIFGLIFVFIPNIIFRITGICLFIVGVILMIYTKVEVWWHHD